MIGDQKTRRLIIGVDGGGTKTRATLGELVGAVESLVMPTVLGAGEAAASNPLTVGPVIAAHNIMSAVDAAFESADMTRCNVEQACLAIAGCGNRKRQRLLAKHLQTSILGDRVIFVSDAEAVWHAGRFAGQGVALIAGTGSIVLGKTADGKECRAGGWGFRIGDGGSGYWIAVEGLRAVAREADGLGPATTLTPAILSRLDLDRTADLVDLIYSDGYGNAEIAALAPIVFDECRNGDSEAKRIVADALAALVDLISIPIRSLGFENDCFDVACAGGILASQGDFYRSLCELIDKLPVRPNRNVFVADPSLGSMLRAVRCVVRKQM